MDTNKEYSKKVAVSGATGFVGRRFLSFNAGKNHIIPLSLRGQIVENLELEGMDTIIHLAGKVHEKSSVPDSAYFEINYELTRRLAERARECGVPHFVYLSSTKVYGDIVEGVMDESSPCHPSDSYGASKLRAEEYLLSLASPSFTVAIIRPPLVYGPGVKGNMIRLLELAEKPVYLPLGDTRNARSMVFLDNLVALINRVLEIRAGGIFLACDEAPLSTDRLLRMIRGAMGRPARLVSLPFFLRSQIRRFRPKLFMRLYGSYVVDNSHTNRVLDFFPPASIETGILEMVNWYLNYKKQ